MKAFWSWARNKFGRIVTGAGVVLSGIEGFDITPIKGPLEGLVGHTWILRITVALFILSWIRHQQVANKASKPSLPPPDPNSIAKLILIVCAIAVGAIAPRAYAAEVLPHTVMPPK